MDTSCDLIRNKFVAHYEAYFGYWPARKKVMEQEVWFKAIDMLDEDEYELEKLIDRLRFNMSANEKPKKPLLEDVERALKQIRHKKQKYSSFGKPNEKTMTLKEFKEFQRRNKAPDGPNFAPPDKAAQDTPECIENQGSRPDPGNIEREVVDSISKPFPGPPARPKRNYMRDMQKECEEMQTNDMTDEDLEIERIEREAW